MWEYQEIMLWKICYKKRCKRFLINNVIKRAKKHSFEWNEMDEKEQTNYKLNIFSASLCTNTAGHGHIDETEEKNVPGTRKKEMKETSKRKWNKINRKRLKDRRTETPTIEDTMKKKNTKNWLHAEYGTIKKRVFG